MIVRTFLVVCVALGSVAALAQEPVPATPPQPVPASNPAPADRSVAEQNIRERSAAYYKALIAADRTSARDYVTPETVRFYDRSASAIILSSQLQSVELSEDGQSATTRAAQTVRMPTGLAFDITQDDRWKLVNGQWYIEARDVYTMETPFGKLPGPPNPAEMQKVVDRSKVEVDPDVAMKKMQQAEAQERAAREAKEKADKEAAEKKAAANKPKLKKKQPPKKSNAAVAPATPTP